MPAATRKLGRTFKPGPDWERDSTLWTVVRLALWVVPRLTGRCKAHWPSSLDDDVCETSHSFLKALTGSEQCSRRRSVRKTLTGSEHSFQSLSFLKALTGSEQCSSRRFSAPNTDWT